MTPVEIITEVDRLLRLLPYNSDFYKRIRIAITPQEYADLRNYIHAYESSKHSRLPIYYNRIRNVPIQVEADPEKPDLIMETKS